MQKRKLLVDGSAITIDVCAACGSVFVDFHEEARHVARKQQRPRTGAPKASSARCPDCHVAMTLYPYEGVGPDVLTCSECMGMHLDLAAQEALRAAPPPTEQEPSLLSRVFRALLPWFE